MDQAIEVVIGKRRKVPTVIQQEAVECGAACLGMILEYYGKIMPLEELREACGVSRDGVKASNMIRAGEHYGLESRGFKAELDDLADVETPVIVHWNFNHFLVLEGSKGKKIYLNDPNSGRRCVSIEEFDQGFTGVVLGFKPGQDFVTGGRKRSLIQSLKSRFSGSASLLYLLVAGLFLVIPGLVTPIFSKVFVDEVLIKNMTGWFRPLILGLIVTGIIKAVLTWLQSYCLIRYHIRLSIIESGRYFRRLLHLPQVFFAQRMAGDLARRVGNNDRVADLLTGKFARAIINLVTVIFYFALMLYFDVLLTILGVGFALLNLLVLRLVNDFRQEQSVNYMLEANKLYGLGSTGLRLIETLKATGSESDFFAKWAGYHARTIVTKQRLDRFNYQVGVFPKLLRSLSTLSILGIGGLRVMQGEMTMGMLVAFQMLMSSFISPFQSLVQLGGHLQEAKGMMAQLDDVFHYRLDPVLEVSDLPLSPAKLSGDMAIRDLTFGYSALGPALIENFSLSLIPGKRVALVGSSGSGKSTVAKLISGLYQPWSGEILFDGKPRAAYSRHSISNSIAVIDQNISLFEGSIRENLTMWDETIGEKHLIQAAKDACIHETINERAGGYDALVSEGGANFSGGQRQRLEIARGLVNNPSILIMDEATSALDSLTEKRIDDHIRRRGCTCIIVAHRLSTIRDCDEIIVMERGKIAQRGTHEFLSKQPGLYADLIKVM